MENITVSKQKSIKAEVFIPADKSISHRSIIIGSLSFGITEIDNFLKSQDCLDTVEVYKQLGVNIHWSKDNKLIIEGKGPKALKQPSSALYFGNSGTGLRLTAGILSAQSFKTRLTGDESLSKRPMRRITSPLQKMGAEISGKNNANNLPLEIRGHKLKAIDFKSPVASAQVKSSILLAGMYSNGRTCVTEPYKSRDHTERMLSFFGAKITVEGLRVCILPPTELRGKKFSIPNDISAAAFFIVAALIIENSEIHLKKVGLNPTRSAVISMLQQMGAKIETSNKKEQHNEPIADIIASSSKLKGIEIKEELIPLLIDELPILMVAATQAEGKTIINNAKELRVKETDRIHSMVTNLRKLGADIKVKNDDVIIKGPTKLKGADVLSYGDHRTAMSMAIAGLASSGKTKIHNTECIKTSFPDFDKIIRRL